jgi:CheY-like chemotaxis protein
MGAAHRNPVTPGPAAAGWPALSRVLICDDRRDVRGVLTDMVRALPGIPDVGVVGDGPAAVRAYATAPADLVLIGVHRGTAAGTGALRLLLDRDPMFLCTVGAFVLR